MNNKKKILYVVVVIILILIFFLLKDNIFDKKTKENNNNNDNGNNTSSISIVRADNNIPKFIDGDFANIKVKTVNDVYTALEKIKDELKIKDVKKELVLDKESTSEKITYYKLKQVYKDVEVYNNNLIVSVDKNGKILSFSGYYIPNINIDINEKKTKEEIEEIIKTDLGENATIYESKKYIYADNSNQKLVYVVMGYSNSKLMEYIVDANTGEIISKGDLYSYATDYEFTGYGLNNKLETVNIEEYYDVTSLKNKYRLVDNKRGISIVDARGIGQDILGMLISSLSSPYTPMVGDISGNSFLYLSNNDAMQEFSKNAITTLKNFEDIYDFYLNVLGRKSYDNEGGKIIINIGMSDTTFGKEKLENAAFNSLNKQMYIGYYNGVSFSASKDVIAHEFTHGVVNSIVSLANFPKNEDKEKAFETGAINEGLADVFGHLIENKNWTMGEDTSVLRDATNPNSMQYPSEKNGKYYFPDGYLTNGGTLKELLDKNDLKSVSDYDNGGIHQNSNVVSHAAYLMYNNGAFNSREEMAKVWYNALFLLPSYANFQDCALAVIKSASNLGLSEKSIKIIREAFITTKMLNDNRLELKGVVLSNEGSKIENANVTVINNSTKKEIKLVTDKNGKFTTKIDSGTYTIKVTKDGYNNYNETININNTANLNIKLVKSETKKCKSSSNCHIVTIYSIDSIEDGKMKKSTKTYEVEDGYVMANDIKKYVGDVNSSDLITWYYKDTNNKFDINTPIHEDISLEIKVNAGDIYYDIDDMEEIYDMINDDRMKAILEMLK